jgi:uncharacterized protein
MTWLPNVLQSGGHRRLAAWPGPTPRSRRFTVKYAIVAFVVSWAAVIALSSLLRLTLSIHIQPIVGVLCLDILWVSALIALHRSDPLAPSDLGIRVSPGARSAMLAFVTLLAVSWVDIFWRRIIGQSGIQSPFSGLSHQSTSVIVLTGVVAIITPFVEEVFFRGLLYRSLRNAMAIVPACLVGGALFGVIHREYSLSVIPELVFYGVALCLLYERTGSLLPGICLNLYLDMGWFERDLTGSSSIVDSVILLIIAVVIVGPFFRVMMRRLTGKPFRHTYEEE